MTSKQQLMDFLELGHLSPRGMFYIQNIRLRQVVRSDIVQEARQNKQNCVSTAFKLLLVSKATHLRSAEIVQKIITLKIVTTKLVPADHSEFTNTILIWQVLYFWTKFTSEMKAEVVKRLRNCPLLILLQDVWIWP